LKGPFNQINDPYLQRHSGNSFSVPISTLQTPIKNYKQAPRSQGKPPSLPTCILYHLYQKNRRKREKSKLYIRKKRRRILRERRERGRKVRCHLRKPAPNDAVKMLTASSVEWRILQKALKTKSAHKMKAN